MAAADAETGTPEPAAEWQFPFCPRPPDWSLDFDGIAEAFPWFRAMRDCPQDPRWHAEGNVQLHTRLVCEALAEILPGLSRDLAAFALRRVRELGIEVRLETPVEHVDEGGVTLKGGEHVPSRTVVWAVASRAGKIKSSRAVASATRPRPLIASAVASSGRCR